MGDSPSEDSSSSRFSLCWNDYKASLISAFESLREGDEFVDVTLGCEGKKFGAHKMLLAACSPYFRTLLKENPCQHPIIILRETKSEDLTAILHFMYHGEVSIEEHRLESFLKSAAAFKVKGLTEGQEQQQDQDQGSSPSSPAAVTAAPISSSTKNSTSSGRKRKPDLLASALGHLGPIKVDGLGQASPAVKHEILVTTTPSAGHPPGVFAAQQQGDHHQQQHQQVQPQTFNLNLAYDQTGAEAFVDDNTSLSHGAMLTGAMEDANTEQPLALVNRQLAAAAAAAAAGNQLFGAPATSSKRNSGFGDGGGGPNHCSDCDKTFKSKNALLDHEHVHKGSTTCPICARVCSTKGNLKQHLVKKHKL